MLRKLIGFEFRATRRVFLPAYLILLALAVLNGISMALTDSGITLPSGLLIAVYGAVVLAVCGMSLVYMIVRYYRNLLGDEGYLMFTLPVRPWQLLWSKAIVSAVWMICTGILCAVTLFVILIPSIFFTNMQDWLSFLWIWDDLKQGIAQAVSTYGYSVWLVPVEALLLGFLAVVEYCMEVYAALSLGQLANRYRLGWAFAAYIGFAVVEAILGSVLQKIPPIDLGPTLNLHLVLCGMLLVVLLQIVVYFLISNYLLNNKLNLQ